MGEFKIVCLAGKINITGTTAFNYYTCKSIILCFMVIILHIYTTRTVINEHWNMPFFLLKSITNSTKVVTLPLTTAYKTNFKVLPKLYTHKSSQES